MKIYHSFENVAFQNTIVTLGIFDGVHLAHQKILTYIGEKSQADKVESVLITFFPHPKSVLNLALPPLKFLSTQAEKIELLADFKVDHLIIVPFDKQFSEITAMQFVTDILITKLHIDELVLGYDHHFGKNREGSIEFLIANKEVFDFKFTEIPKQFVGNTAINSSNIRQMLAEGNVAAAAKCLNRPYCISGIVVKGNQLGRKLGFPTANISINDASKLIPANGVYAVEIKIKNYKNHFGMLNIGYRPTVNGKDLAIEVHIFDFDEYIYDQQISVELKYRLREEQKFDSIETLTHQLEIDKKNSLMYFDAKDKMIE